MSDENKFIQREFQLAQQWKSSKREKLVAQPVSRISRFPVQVRSWPACINLLKATVFMKLLQDFIRRRGAILRRVEAQATCSTHALQHALTRKLTVSSVLTPAWRNSLPHFPSGRKKNDFNQPLALPWDQPAQSVELHIHYCPLFANGWPDKNLSPYDHDRSPLLPSCLLPFPLYLSLTPSVYRYIYIGRAELLDEVNYRVRDMGNWKISTTSSLVSSVSNLETGEWTGSYRACLVSAVTNGDRFECDRFRI